MEPNEERALRRFAEAMEEADVPDVEALVRAHPELEGELRSLAGALGWFDGVVGAPDASGDELDLGPRFDVEGVLAVGGMGRIIKVHDLELGRRIAVKVGHVGQGTADGAAALRFEREVRITSRLDHPGIVPLHDAGVDGAGRPWFSMRLVRGRDLLTALASDEEGDLRERVRVVQRAAEIVDHAHRRGILHRDLKPANVMTDGLGSVHVVDWGLALELDAKDEGDGADSAAWRLLDDARLTAAGAVLGTPVYMAPEQAVGNTLALGAWTDVYGLGAILHHVLAGAPPFEDEVAKRGGGAVLEAHRKGQRATAPGGPRELVAIARRAMAPDPRARYGSARAFASDLNAWLEGRVVSAAPPGLFGRVGRWGARHRGLASGLLLALVVAVAAATVVALQSSRAARELGREQEATEAALEQASDQAARAELTAATLLVGRDRPGPALDRLERIPPDRRDWAWRHVFAAVGERPETVPSPDGSAIAGVDEGGGTLWIVTERGNLYRLRGGEWELAVETGMQLAQGMIVSADGSWAIVRFHDVLGSVELAAKGEKPRVELIARPPTPVYYWDLDELDGGTRWSAFDRNDRITGTFGGGVPPVVTSREAHPGMNAWIPLIDGAGDVGISGGQVWRKTQGEPLSVLGAVDVLRTAQVPLVVDEERRLAIVGERTGSIVAFDLDEGREVWRTKVGASKCVFLDAAPDPAEVLAALDGGTCVALNRSTGQATARFLGQEVATKDAARFGAAGSLVALGEDGAMRRWETPTVRPVVDLGAALGARPNLIQDPESGDLIFLSGTAPFSLDDKGRPALVFEEPPGHAGHHVSDVRWLWPEPDEPRLVVQYQRSGYMNEPCTVAWDARSGRIDWIHRDESGRALGLTLAQGTPAPIVLTDRHLKHLDARTGEVVLELETSLRSPSSVVAVEGGSLLVFTRAGRLVRLDPSTGTVLEGRRFGRGSGGLAVRADGRAALLVDASRHLLMVDTHTLETIWRVRAHDTMSVRTAFSSDGSMLVTVGNDGVFTVRDPSTGEELTRSDVPRRNYVGIQELDGDFVATSTGGLVVVHDGRTSPRFQGLLNAVLPGSEVQPGNDDLPADPPGWAPLERRLRGVQERGGSMEALERARLAVLARPAPDARSAARSAILRCIQRSELPGEELVQGVLRFRGAEGIEALALAEAWRRGGALDRARRFLERHGAPEPRMPERIRLVHAALAHTLELGEPAARPSPPDRSQVTNLLEDPALGDLFGELLREMLLATGR